MTNIFGYFFSKLILVFFIYFSFGLTVCIETKTKGTLANSVIREGQHLGSV